MMKYWIRNNICKSIMEDMVLDVETSVREVRKDGLYERVLALVLEERGNVMAVRALEGLDEWLRAVCDKEKLNGMDGIAAWRSE